MANRYSTLSDPYRAITSPEIICTIQDHQRKKNCKKNPWCLYGLGEFKEGIWSDSTKLLNKLGPDLSQSYRASDDSGVIYPPAGLRNAGATCYLNVFIQAMFHNVLIRNLLLTLSLPNFPLITENSNCINLEMENMKCSREQYSSMKIVYDFQLVLYRLQVSAKKVIDPRAFIDSLCLPVYIQQDPQEFHKLFLSKLEQFQTATTTKPTSSSSSSASLSTSLDPNQFHSLKTIFQGVETQCLTCDNCRHVRKTKVEISELSLPLTSACDEYLSNSKGNNLRVNLLDAINAYQGQELLSDPLDCSNCDTRSPNMRQTKLTSLPPILCIHLLRYTYNRETMDKMKLKIAVDYPLEMTLLGEEYVLTSVIYHLGTSAYGGHYVTDCLDWSSRNWYHYDDESVYPITSEFVLGGVQQPQTTIGSAAAAIVVEDINANETNKAEESRSTSRKRGRSASVPTSSKGNKSVSAKGGNASKRNRKQVDREVTIIDSDSNDNLDDEEAPYFKEEVVNVVEEEINYEEDDFEELKKGANKSKKIQKKQPAQTKKRKVKKAINLDAESGEEEEVEMSEYEESTKKASKGNNAKRGGNKKVTGNSKTTKPAAAAANSKKTKKKVKGKKDDDSDDEEVEEAVVEDDEDIEVVNVPVTNVADSSSSSKATKESKRGRKFNRQQDVYMLYYVQKKFLPKITPAASLSSSSAAAAEEISPILSNPGMLLQTPSAHIQTIVNQENEADMKEYEACEERQLQVKSWIEERKKQYENLHDNNLLVPSMPTNNSGSRRGNRGSPKDCLSFHLLPTEWIKQWIVGDISTFPTPISMLDTTIGGTTEKKVEEDNDEVMIVEINGNTNNKNGNDVEVENLIDGDGTSKPKGKKQKKMIGVHNFDRLCPHGRLHTQYIEHYKVVSSAFFQTMFASSSSALQSSDDTKSSLSNGSKIMDLTSPVSSSSSSSSVQGPAMMGMYSADPAQHLADLLDYDLRADNYRCCDCFDQWMDQRKNYQDEEASVSEILTLLETIPTPPYPPIETTNIDGKSTKSTRNNNTKKSSSTRPRKEVVNLDESESGGNENQESWYWVSRAWLQLFRRYAAKIQKLAQAINLESQSEAQQKKGGKTKAADDSKATLEDFFPVAGMKGKSAKSNAPNSATVSLLASMKDIITLRQETFGEEVLNGNLVCEDHVVLKDKQDENVVVDISNETQVEDADIYQQQNRAKQIIANHLGGCLSYEKRSILVPALVWNRLMAFYGEENCIPFIYHPSAASFSCAMQSDGGFHSTAENLGYCTHCIVASSAQQEDAMLRKSTKQMILACENLAGFVKGKNMPSLLEDYDLQLAKIQSESHNQSDPKQQQQKQKQKKERLVWKAEKAILLDGEENAPDDGHYENDSVEEEGGGRISPAESMQEEIVYYLVDHNWCSSLRAFLANTSSTSSSNSNNAPSVPSIPITTLCCAHGRVTIDSIINEDKTAGWESKGVPEIPASTSVASIKGKKHAVEMVTKAQYDLLVKFHGVEGNDPDETTYVVPKLHYSPLFKEWNFHPHVCKECLQAQYDSEEFASYNYNNESLYFYYFKDIDSLVKHLPANVTISSKISAASNSNANNDEVAIVGEGTASSGGEVAIQGGIGAAELTTPSTRRSVRSARLPKRQVITVSSNDNIGLIKLKLFEACQHYEHELSPTQQVLYLASTGECLSATEKTLAEYRVSKGAIVYLISGHGQGDVEESLQEWCVEGNISESTKKRRRPVVEEGFTGTFFSSFPTSAAAATNNNSNNNNHQNTREHSEVIELEDSQSQGFVSYQ